jgi:hypothetical protein
MDYSSFIRSSPMRNVSVYSITDYLAADAGLAFIDFLVGTSDP